MLRIYVTPPPTITSEDGDISSPPSDGTTPGAPPPLAAAPPGRFFQELLDPRLFGQFAPPPSAPPGKFFQELLDPRRFGQNAPPPPTPPGQFLASIGVNLPPVVPPVPEPPTLAVRPVPAQDVALDNALLDSAPATGPALPGQDIAGFGTTVPRMPAEFERTRGDGIWRNAAAGFSGHVYDRVGQSADPAAEVINYGIDGLNRVAGTDVERLPAPSRWLAKNAETYLGVPDPQHTLAVTAGEKAARLGGKAAAFLAELRLLRGRSLPGYGLPGPGLPVPGDRPGPPAPGGPGHPERWDASYEDARDLGQFGLDLFGELRDAIYPPAPRPLKSLDQASDGLVGGVIGPGDAMPQEMVQGGRIADSVDVVRRRVDRNYSPDVSSKDVTEVIGKYGVAFFGESNLRYYTVDHPTLGKAGQSFFAMPFEDSAVITDAASAARYTGMSKSTQDAYLSKDEKKREIYGIMFPTEGLMMKAPTRLDANDWGHYLEGGHTAVRLPDPNGGYLINPTREFVILGGNAVPRGSILFKLGPRGERITIRRF